MTFKSLSDMSNHRYRRKESESTSSTDRKVSDGGVKKLNKLVHIHFESVHYDFEDMRKFSEEIARLKD